MSRGLKNSQLAPLNNNERVRNASIDISSNQDLQLGTKNGQSLADKSVIVNSHKYQS